MGTVETRTSKTLDSPSESEKIESANEKTVDLTEEGSIEKRDDSVAVEEGQENGFSDLGEIDVTGKDEDSGVENGVSLGANENKPDDDDGRGFSVGDFVWGKIKSHPWWPGQIYDPANVSEFAAKIKHKGKHLVAYFGDGTFAWCESSQLKPFEESFDEMSKQSLAKGFVSAVLQAMDEIGRVLESETTCSCVPEENKARLARSVAENAGVRAGSLVPDGKIRRFHDVLADPAELLSVLKRIALSGRNRSIEVVELGVLTSRVSSFYRLKGVLELPRYQDPISVPGLEDKANLAVETRAQGPLEEEWLPQAVQSLLRSCTSGSENKRNPRRKQRSIADLIATEGTSSEKKKMNKKRKRRDKDDLVEDDDDRRRLISSTPKATKKARLSLGSRSSTRNDSENEDGDSAVEKTLEKSSSFREKKKSKYLSPPFVDSKAAKTKKNAEPSELPKVVSAEDRNKDWFADVSTNEFLSEVRSTAVNPFSQSGKKSAGMVSDFVFVYRESVYCNEAEKTPRPRKRKRKISDSESPNQPMDESPETNLSSAAEKSEEKRVKTCGRKEKEVTETPEAKKRTPNRPVEKSPETQKSSPAEKSKENKKLESRGRKKKKQVSEAALEAEKKTASKEEEATKSRRGRKKKNPESETAEANNKESIDEKILPATLIVEFAPASILPSKSDLIGMYEKYGDLDKAKTDMYYANQCARIYFLNGSEAQIAYTESKKESPFGSNSVEFVLECPSHEYKTRVLQEITSEKKKKKTPKKVSKGKSESELGFVKSKLEKISSMLDEKDGKMSPAMMKSKIKGEISSLLEKVSSMVAGSSSA